MPPERENAYEPIDRCIDLLGDHGHPRGAGDMLHTYYRHREGRTIRQYELEDFLYLYRGYKALGGNSFIDRIKSEIDEWEVIS